MFKFAIIVQINLMKKIFVKSSKKTYSVTSIKNLKITLEKLNKNNNIHILVDKNIFNLFKTSFENKIIYKSFYIVEAIEDNKDIYHTAKYIEYLIKNKIKKDHKIVAVGGGLVQDIASFTASILLRGIDWIYIPTTLLAMADSCIGSKSGINVGKYKNQIGAFHPPSEIYIYFSFLINLPKKEVINGIGEIIKHAFIKGSKEFDYIIKNINNVPGNKKITEEIIYKSLLIKKEIVEKDEFENNYRKLLNYGHTFGHALEGYTKHAIPHGLGVLIGMDIANYISVNKKMLSLSDFKRNHEIISRHTSHYNIKNLDLNRYLDFISHDKKSVEDGLNVILCNGIGKTEIVKIKIDNLFKKSIKEYFYKYII